MPQAWHRRGEAPFRIDSHSVSSLRRLSVTHHKHFETMSEIGPELPPHLLAKRKRKQEQEGEDETSTASGAKRSSSPGEGEKRRRVMGPASPPAPLEERPIEPLRQVEQSDSDDDDGFGPALPPSGSEEVRFERLYL